MAGDVGQRLLRDAVDDELDLGRHIDVLRQPAQHGDAGVALEPARQRGERAVQAELLQRVGAQPARDPPHLLGAVTRGLAQLLELVAQLLGDARGEPFDLQHHAGQRLADLVVQLARDPPALGLLDRQRLARAVTALGLEPVEHVVERLREGDDARVAGHVGADARA